VLFFGGKNNLGFDPVNHFYFISWKQLTPWISWKSLFSHFSPKTYSFDSSVYNTEVEIEIENGFHFRLASNFVFKKNIVRVLIFHFLWTSLSHMISSSNVLQSAFSDYERNQQIWDFSFDRIHCFSTWGFLHAAVCVNYFYFADNSLENILSFG
jgi:hypothetical protein